MDSIKKGIIMVVTLLASCDLIQVNDLCQFADMFPSKANEKCFVSTKDSRRTLCPTNMKYTTCSCQATCADPRNQNGCYNVCTEEETCMCPDGFLMNGDDCVPEEDCGCFLEAQGVVMDGGIFINSNCSRCSCSNNQILCEDSQCSANSNCRKVEDAHQCECKDGFVEDGQNCDMAVDCFDLYNFGKTTTGVYTIHPLGWAGKGFEVYCEMESNGGGWTVFQRRINGTVEFYRNWASYKQGFGVLSHEFWLGNDKIHILTQQTNYQLRIDVWTSQGTSVYSLYGYFNISDENSKYRLTLGEHSGNTVGNPLNWNNGQPFSTYDQDNDDTSFYNCAKKHHGAWWYKYVPNDGYARCFKWQVDNIYGFCGDSNLNGDYQQNRVESVFFWNSYNYEHDCHIQKTEMKLRPL